MRNTLEIARWEFLRFFKLRDVLLSIALVGVVVAATSAVSWWQRRTRDEVRLAVIAPMPVEPAGRVQVDPRPAAEEAALRARVARGELDGLLLVDAAGGVRLIARKEPPWLRDATAVAGGAVQAERLRALGVAPERVAAALAPVPVALELTEGTHRGSARAAAVFLVIAMLVILFSGASYLFVAITGEKQQRAAEQLFTMTSPQQLIDGKLLGVTAMSLASTAQMTAIALVGWNAIGAPSLHRAALALSGVGAGDLLVLLGFTLGGCAFWLAALAALFATIDDPNSSARTTALFLPALPLSVAFIGLGNPESSMMQILTFVPFTSMTVVPTRLVLGEIGGAAIAASFVLLVAGTWLLRIAAARIYTMGMLLYGKEPSLREMWRWLRVTSPR